MVLTYSGKSKIGAQAIAEASGGDIALNRGGRGDINWGRARANTSLNPDISNVTNKRVMRELFASHNVPMPKLVSKEFLLNGIHNFAVVGRPDTHTKGRGFWLCATPLGVAKAMHGTRKKRAATHFMEFIVAPREYRVHIFKGKSIRISQKVFAYEDTPDGGMTIRNYVTGKPTHNINHVRAAAKKALDAVGLDFGAVDILANDSECWVLEVNAAPGLGGSMGRLYAQVFNEWEEGNWE